MRRRRGDRMCRIGLIVEGSNGIRRGFPPFLKLPEQFLCPSFELQKVVVATRMGDSPVDPDMMNSFPAALQP